MQGVQFTTWHQNCSVGHLSIPPSPMCIYHCSVDIKLILDVYERYALAIIMWELASRKRPYELATPTIIGSVIPLGDRETELAECPYGYMELVRQCWDQEPENRPEIEQVLVEVRRIKRDWQNFFNAPSLSPHSSSLTASLPLIKETNTNSTVSIQAASSCPLANNNLNSI